MRLYLILLPISSCVTELSKLAINHARNCYQIHLISWKKLKFSKFIFLPFFYHLPVKSIFFTNLPVNLKAGKSSTLVPTLFLLLFLVEKLQISDTLSSSSFLRSNAIYLFPFVSIASQLSKLERTIRSKKINFAQKKKLEMYFGTMFELR